MARFFSQAIFHIFATVGMLSLTASNLWAADKVAESSSKGTASARMNCGARIECVTPDGQTGQVSKMPTEDSGATALIMEDDTITCLLQEGETNFVIELPPATLIDHLTFLNENGVARGELKIAVSNHRLRADSPGWVNVEGIIPFAHKRLFGVSLLGIEAKFVRLSFQVERQGRIAAGAGNDKPATSDKMQNSDPALPLETFRISALNDAVSSKFTTRYAREAILLSQSSASVGPLSALSR
jgi:hypothetical protein